MCILCSDHGAAETAHVFNELKEPGTTQTFFFRAGTESEISEIAQA